MTEVLPENSFPERMKALARAFGNRERLARACGISAVMLGRYESGAEPSRDKLLALVEATGVRIEWLVSGRGPMKAEPSVVAEEQMAWRELLSEENLAPQKDQRDAYGRRGDDVFCYIPLYDVNASAGGGAVVEQERVEGVLSFKTEWVRTQLHASPADLYLIHVEGESMEPTLRPGDVILIDHRKAEALLRDGIYVVRMDDTLLVKRLQRMPGNQVRVTSDNPAYQPFTVQMGDGREVEIIGRVVWCGRRM